MEKSIEIMSTIDNLRLVEKFVDEISLECKLNSEIYGNVLIATLEAVNNAIVHGNKSDESKKVKLSAIAQKNQLEILIKDEGKGFDYLNIPDPTSPENIEKISGRGVFLMEKLSDQIIFRENGSNIEMIFKF